MPGVNEEVTNLSSYENSDVNKLYITAEETEKPEEAKVEGKIPSYALGTYLRVGPAHFDFQNFTMKHWLDGYAMLSKFEIKEDSVIFEKKYLQTDAYKRAVALQKPAINEFATRAQPDGKKGFFSRVISNLLPEFTDNSYSTLFHIGSELFATCDTQYFHKINSEGLGIECKCDTNKSFGVNGHCAHPLTDPITKDIWNFGFSVGATGMKYHLFKMPFAKSSEEMIKKTRTVATMSPRWTGQMGTTHSFGMSENFVILVEQPFTVSAKRIAASLVKGDVLNDWLCWQPEHSNLIRIVEKKTGKIFKTEFLTTKAFYFLHFINCYEESNQIIVDIIIYDSPNSMDTMLIKNLRGENFDSGPVDLPYVQRFIVPIIPDLKAASNIEENVNLVTKPRSRCSAIRSGNKILITGEKLSDGGMDLPTINQNYFTKKTKFVYAAGTFHQSRFTNSVCKVNLENPGEILTWKNCNYTYPGEAIFVPNNINGGGGGDNDDNGILLVGVTDKRFGQGHKDFLVILNARDMTEIGRAQFNSHIPCSLHGIHVHQNENHIPI